MVVMMPPVPKVEIDARSVVVVVVMVMMALIVPIPIVHLLGTRVLARCDLEVTRQAAGGRSLTGDCQEAQGKGTYCGNEPVLAFHSVRSFSLCHRRAVERNACGLPSRRYR
jgi:hypothetical protein